MTEVDNIVKEINSIFGEGTMALGNDEAFRVKYWPTGIMPVDHILNGGIPAGRFIEIFGDYSSLKSYIALKAIATVQSLGGKVALIDTEHAYDADWAEAIGIDTTKLMLQQPPNAEAAIGVMELLVRNQFDLIVWDSIAASQPKQYEEAKPGEDKAPAALARVMSNGLRRLNSVNKKTAILAINQTRVNVGMTYGGAREAIPGGKSMPFYASFRMRLTKAGRINEEIKVHDGEKLVGGKKIVSMKIKMTLEKSKLSKPFSEEWFLYNLGSGSIDETMFLISQGIEAGLILDKQGRFTIPGVLDKSIHGKPRFKQHVEDNEEVMEWLTNEVMGPDYLKSLGKLKSPGRSKGGRRKKVS